MRSKRPQLEEAILYPGVVLRGSQTIILKAGSVRVTPLHPQPVTIQKLSSTSVDKSVGPLSARRKTAQKSVV